MVEEKKKLTGEEVAGEIGGIMDYTGLAGILITFNGDGKSFYAAYLNKHMRIYSLEKTESETNVPEVIDTLTEYVMTSIAKNFLEQRLEKLGSGIKALAEKYESEEEAEDGSSGKLN